MKKNLLFLYIVSISFSFLLSNEYSDVVYNSIEDINNPTVEDYRKVEVYLEHGKRQYVSQINSRQYWVKSKKFKLTPSSENPSHKITHKIIPVNCNIEDKENCIILYASCNYLYPEALLKLVERIKKSNFIGHIIYRIGGWPNVEQGDLKLAHIPYAFKVCAFREAYGLGYKRALWLDAPMYSITSLNTIFDHLKDMGIFTYYQHWSITDITKKRIHLSFLGLTAEEAKNLYTVATGLLGIDFTDKRALTLLNDWYLRTKEDEKASCTTMVETCLFSLILNKYYEKEHFFNFEKHIYCPEHLNDENRPTDENLHFVYTKQDVQPGWPRI